MDFEVQNHYKILCLESDLVERKYDKQISRKPRNNLTCTRPESNIWKNCNWQTQKSREIDILIAVPTYLKSSKHIRQWWNGIVIYNGKYLLIY